MKITILEKEPGEEDEIIVKCGQLDEKLMRLINQFKSGGKGKMNFYKDSKIGLKLPVPISEISDYDLSAPFVSECGE